MIQRTYPEYVAADIAIAMKEFLAQLGAEVFRFSGDPLTLLDGDAAPVRQIAPPLLQQIEVPGGSARQGIGEGLACLSYEGTPMLAYCCQQRDAPQQYHISVLAHDVAGAQQLLEAFSTFADGRRTVTSKLFGQVADSLNSRVRAHMGEGAEPGVITKSFPEYQIANISIQTKEFLEGLGAEFTGAGAAQDSLRFMHAGGWEPLELLKPANIDEYGQFTGYRQTAAAFEQIDIQRESRRLGLRAGIALFRYAGAPMFAYCRREGRMQEEYLITVVARDVAAAQRLLDDFVRHERAHSILRGRLLRPRVDYTERVTQAEILPFTDVGWDRVVLPERLRRRIERDVIGFIRAAPALAANGIEPKRSFLFHGPPGTGKTFICKLLATELRGFTSVLVAGDDLRRPGGPFALARSLQPALLFFEDVDLVASERDGNPFPTALGGLLNELDGLPPNELLYVVFTTNRLNVLEEALAQRPGRVDMIIGFPLPDPALRRRLIALYGGASRVCEVDVDWIVDHTEGVTPAFLREFTKETVFTAIEEGSVDDHGIALVQRAHVEAAFDHFAEIRKEHAADRILGFRT